MLYAHFALYMILWPPLVWTNFILENGISSDNSENFPRMIELWFLFASIWALGGSLTEISKMQFDSFIRGIDGQFPSKDTVFEYFVDKVNKTWVSWETKLPNGWRYTNNIPFYKIYVPTVDSIRSEFIIRSLIKKKRPVLLIGDSGVGKTSLIQSIVGSPEVFATNLTINLSALSSSVGIQSAFESKLERRTKNIYFPIGGRQLLTFLDDLNMPAKDEFGSQPALELLRHWIDYGFVYDRQKQTTKYFNDILLIAAMGPPGGGRNHINSRIQSRFSIMHMAFPSEESVTRIYKTILNQKLQDFEEDVKPLGDILTTASLEIYHNIVTRMLPTPSRLHYLFNMRDISRVFQGLLRAHRDYYDSRESMIKLWIHEMTRVFSDRLVDENDRSYVSKLMADKLLSHFAMDAEQVYPANTCPLFGDFMNDSGAADNQIYLEISDMDKLKNFMVSKMSAYNEVPELVQADLVLFNCAINHICRITRVLRQQSGHMVLIGVGGSGRQALARLSSYVTQTVVFQIKISKNYRHSDFREDMRSLYIATTANNQPRTFLFTDSEITNDLFLEDICNILSSGEVSFNLL